VGQLLIANFSPQLTPQLLKEGAVQALNGLMAPIIEDYTANVEWQKVEKLAYPAGKA